MKKILSFLLVLIMCFSITSLFACNNDVTSPENVIPIEEETLENCQHVFVGEESSDSFRSSATCTKPRSYYKYCSKCGLKSEDDFLYLGEPLGHSFDVEDTSYQYFASKNGRTAKYYTSCSKCGEKGDETFDVQLGNVENYSITSPTITLYSTIPTLSYGFTWNTLVEPISPIIEIKKSTDSKYQRFPARVQKYTQKKSETNTKEIDVFVAKIQIELQPNTQYNYRIYDFAYDIGSKDYSFTTKTAETNSFSFVSIGDSQSNNLSSNKQGKYLGNVLKNVTNADFILHTGDIEEHPMYYQDASDMINYNNKYFATIPVMPVSGNHDTSSGYGGLYELDKYFNNNIPTQTNNGKGYYYSFIYGNAKFIAINTNEGGYTISKEQYNWLINELQNNTQTWTIVYMHCPLYSEGQWGAEKDRKGQSIALRGQLANVFAQYGVDLVIQGHDHLVTKTNSVLSYDSKTEKTTLANETFETIDGVKYSVNPKGVFYVMNGPSGNETKPRKGANDDLYDYVIDNKISSWAEYTITDNILKVEVKYYEGNTAKNYTTYGIIKK